jgi:hypothetical protein
VKHRLVLGTGVGAALPVIVSTVHAVSAGWLPLGDDAIIAVRSYDVLSTHPPLLGSYSASSQVIGQPVLSPGPLLFWLLALPVRLGEVAPAVTMGIVNVCAVVGVVALARRRGGLPLMFATGAVVAAMCGSLEARIFSDVWNPSAAVIPFTLLTFLAWSLAAGDYKLLPVAALVASFVVQSHLTYALPSALLLVVALGFLAASRPSIPRRWLVATAAVVLVCWSFPVAEEAVHRPGNLERIVQVATTGTSKFGAAAGWHAVVHSAGIPPWWLRSPRVPFARLAEVTYAPDDASSASAVALILALIGVAVVAFRARRRDLAAAAVLALALLLSIGVVTASTPTSHGLFAVIYYTLWWAAPAGMFAWLVLGFGACALAVESGLLRRVRARLVAPGSRVRSAAAVAAVVGVAAVAGVVASSGEPDRLEHAFRPARTIVDRVRTQTPPGGTVLVTGSPDEIGVDLQGAVAYALRSSGVPFVVSSLPGIGTRYDPARHPHDRSMAVTDRPARGGREIARVVLVDVPADAPSGGRGPRTVLVTLQAGKP